MMLPEELMRQVRLIELTTRKVVDDVLSGQYKSHFKGHGVQFSEHRLYVPGDDVRHIDWKVSARSRDPLVKKYEEERELTVFIVVDVSASLAFGSTKKLKTEMTAQVAGMLAYAATYTGDKVGMLLFSDQVEKIVPPKKGRVHIQRLIGDLLSYQPRSKGTDLAGALDATGRLMKHAGVIFVMSDFLAQGYEIPLKRLAKRHDVVAVSVGDERETKIPEVGNLLLFDPETGQERLVDTSSYQFKTWLKDQTTERAARTEQLFKSSRIENLKILTSENYGDCVVKFFRARARGNKRPS